MKLALLIPVAFLIVLSGCTQTGQFIEDRDQRPAEISDINEAITHEEIETETPEPVSCDGIDCGKMMTTCPDGFESACGNPCKDGKCLPCKPDCTGHEKTATVPPSKCSLECGICEVLDKDECRCDSELFCDGNGICEQGEYPGSKDCPDCDDGDPGTADSYDHDFRTCVNEPVPYCGDEDCNGNENEETCPEDCAEEYTGDVRIIALDERDEWVELEGYNVIMDGWSLSDEGEKHNYAFPVWFMIDGRIKLHRGYGEDNMTDLFWQSNSHVWNNDGDTATLKDNNGEIIDTYSY